MKAAPKRVRGPERKRAARSVARNRPRTRIGGASDREQLIARGDAEEGPLLGGNLRSRRRCVTRAMRRWPDDRPRFDPSPRRSQNRTDFRVTKWRRASGNRPSAGSPGGKKRSERRRAQPEKVDVFSGKKRNRRAVEGRRRCFLAVGIARRRGETRPGLFIKRVLLVETRACAARRLAYHGPPRAPRKLTGTFLRSLSLNTFLSLR